MTRPPTEQGKWIIFDSSLEENSLLFYILILLLMYKYLVFYVGLCSDDGAGFRRILLIFLSKVHELEGSILYILDFDVYLFYFN